MSIKQSAVLSTLPLVAAALILGLAYILPAFANHIAGATYTGTHDGGGAIWFRVSADGSGVEHFEVEDIPCDGSLVTTSLDFTPPLAIDGNHNFSRTGTGIQRLSFTGSFPTAGQAQGTVRYEQSNIPFVQPGCDSGILNWSASTGAATPTATETETETPMPTPTETLPPGEAIWGDGDCGGVANLGDVIGVARHLVSLPVNKVTEDCPDLGTSVMVDGEDRIWQDIDCSGAVSLGDAIGIARFLVALPVNKATEDCPDVDDLVFIG